MEKLRGVYHIVLVAETKVLTLRESCVDTVNESVGEYVLLVYPLLKCIAKCPKVSILKNALLEVITVSVDKLARKEDKSGKSKLKAALKKKSYLCREGLRRCIGNLILRRESMPHGVPLQMR